MVFLKGGDTSSKVVCLVSESQKVCAECALIDRVPHEDFLESLRGLFNAGDPVSLCS